MSESFSGESIATAMSAAPAESSAPAPETTSAPSPAAAGVLPAAETATTAQAASDGSTTTQTDPAQTQTPAASKPTAPPPETWPKILDNARTKAAQETEAKYQWAASIPEQHRQTVGQFYQLLDGDPTSAVEVLISQIANDPQHAPKLRSLFGKMLGTRSAPAQNAPQPGALPDPDFQDTDGHHFYSADRMPEIVAAIEARIDAKYATKLGPLEQDFRTRQQRDAEATRKAEAATWATSEHARLTSEYPRFSENEAEIAELMQANPDLTVHEAYIRIAVPKLQQQERSSVVAHLHDKAAASGIPPSSATAAARRPTDFLEAFHQLPAGTF